MSAKPIGLGLIGAGMVARYHAQAIAQTAGARLVAVCRGSESSAAARAEAAGYFGVPCEESLAALLARPDLDAVCVCTPSGLHAEQTIAAAQAGKHILVEKPLALSLADADAMLAACATHNVILATALQRRADPHFQALHTAIHQGDLGRMLLGSVSVPYVRPQSYYDSAAWRGTWALDGGGALMNQGVHLVDLLVWLMGDVAEVSARFDTLDHNIEVEDCLAATLRFQHGALGSIIATTAAAPGFPHRVEVYGSQGSAQIEGETIIRWATTSGDRTPSQAAIPQAAGAGAAPTGISPIGHIRIMRDFVDAVQTGRSPIVSGAEARRSLAIVLAIYESARSHSWIPVRHAP